MFNDFEARVIELTNAERDRYGLRPLIADPTLMNAAETHSQNMGLLDFYSHTGRDGSNSGNRAAIAGYPNTYVGENIAAGQATPEAVVQAWMNSTGHRENILNPDYRSIGVGHFFLAEDTGSVRYNHYWSQNFGRNFSAAAPPNASTIVEPIPMTAFQQIHSTANASSVFYDLSNGADGVQIPAEVRLSHPGGVRSFDGNDSVTGSASTDVINGNRGNDTLRGGDGEDYLRGGKDEDWLLGDRGNDILNGNFENDTVDGGAGNDMVRGGQGNDFLLGGDGEDILVGDFGTDTLTGGAGVDIFLLRQETETSTNANLADVIADFTVGDRLVIQGNLAVSDLVLVSSGADTLIRANGNVILGVVKNTTSNGLIALNPFEILPTTDNALKIG